MTQIEKAEAALREGAALQVAHMNGGRVLVAGDVRVPIWPIPILTDSATCWVWANFVHPYLTKEEHAVATAEYDRLEAQDAARKADAAATPSDRFLRRSEGLAGQELAEVIARHLGEPSAAQRLLALIRGREAAARAKAAEVITKVGRGRVREPVGLFIYEMRTAARGAA